MTKNGKTSLFSFTEKSDTTNSLGTGVSWRQWCHLLREPPAQAAHGKVSIAVHVAGTRQHTWIWGPKYRYWFQKWNEFSLSRMEETKKICNSTNKTYTWIWWSLMLVG